MQMIKDFNSTLLFTLNILSKYIKRNIASKHCFGDQHGDAVGWRLACGK